MSFRKAASNLSISANSNIEQAIKEPKYIFLGFFIHGEYTENAFNHPSVKNYSCSTLNGNNISIPTLLQYNGCAPGNSLIGEPTGVDNQILTDYFMTNGETNLLTGINTTESKINLLKENFLNYINTIFEQNSFRSSRDLAKEFIAKNPNDPDISRDDNICNNMIGVSNKFANKSYFSNNLPQLRDETFDDKNNWGIFIYNNNVGIEPGTNINIISQIKKEPISKFINGKEHITGFEYNLIDIISMLTTLCGLEETDYIFIFDYTCNNISPVLFGKQTDLRDIRVHGSSIQKVLTGKGGKYTKKLRNRRHRKNLRKSLKKKTKKQKNKK